MIDVSHLYRNYGAFCALNDVSFHVDRGEVVGLLGPNGAGKTTAMRILTGYMPPTEGQVRVAGYDVIDDSIEVRRRIGYLPESVPLYGEMTVRAYMHYMASLRHVPDRAAAVMRALEACHIADRATDLIDRLSKGLRQRVGLAQAILHDPEVLVLDEPTMGLDPKQIAEVRQLIQEIGREHTVVLSTHILPEASQTCDRLLIIDGGAIVAQGTPDELTRQMQGAGRIVVQIGGSGGGAHSLLGSTDGVLDVHPQGGGRYEVTCAPGVDARPQLARAILSQGWDLVELHAVDMSLEEIYLRLTVDDAAANEEAHRA